MLRRVLYISRIAEGVTNTTLRHIVASAQINNRRQDLSGVLALGPGLFAQVLEGAAEALQPTLARIMADGRHQDIHVVFDGEAPKRLFDRWSMELLVDETSAAMIKDVHEGRRSAEEFLAHLCGLHSQDPMWWQSTLNALALAA